MEKQKQRVKMLNINVYTDGACSGNPGPGGWAALILIKSANGADDKNPRKEKVTIKGGEKHTTNNRMELTAVIEALRFIRKNIKDYSMDIRIFSDSAYVVDSINNGDLLRWQHNGWKTKRDTDISNKDLWEKMAKADEKMSPSFIRIKGHAGNKFNEYVDKVAVAECDKYKKILKDL